MERQGLTATGFASGGKGLPGAAISETTTLDPGLRRDPVSFKYIC
jgi:hypothetical protein